MKAKKTLISFFSVNSIFSSKYGVKILMLIQIWTWILFLFHNFRNKNSQAENDKKILNVGHNSVSAEISVAHSCPNTYCDHFSSISDETGSYWFLR